MMNGTERDVCIPWLNNFGRDSHFSRHERVRETAKYFSCIYTNVFRKTLSQSNIKRASLVCCWVQKRSRESSNDKLSKYTYTQARSRPKRCPAICLYGHFFAFLRARLLKQQALLSLSALPQLHPSTNEEQISDDSSRVYIRARLLRVNEQIGIKRCQGCIFSREISSRISLCCCCWLAFAYRCAGRFAPSSYIYIQIESSSNRWWLFSNELSCTPYIYICLMRRVTRLWLSCCCCCPPRNLWHILLPCKIIFFNLLLLAVCVINLIPLALYIQYTFNRCTKVFLFFVFVPGKQSRKIEIYLRFGLLPGLHKVFSKKELYCG